MVENQKYNTIERPSPEKPIRIIDSLEDSSNMKAPRPQAGKFRMQLSRNNIRSEERSNGVL